MLGAKTDTAAIKFDLPMAPLLTRMQAMQQKGTRWHSLREKEGEDGCDQIVDTENVGLPVSISRTANRRFPREHGMHHLERHQFDGLSRDHSKKAAEARVAN